MKGRKGNKRRSEKLKDPATRRSSRGVTGAAVTDARVADAEKQAGTFAKTAIAFGMPPFLKTKPYKKVAEIWATYEPMLRGRRFFEPEYIVPFTGFCIYAEEFLAADQHVKKRGWGLQGKSTSGGARYWTNPAVAVRDHAFARVLELSTKFGLTPIDRYRLERESAAAGAGGRVPLPEDAGELPLPSPAAQQPSGTGPGSLTAFDTPRPPKLDS